MIPLPLAPMGAAETMTTSPTCQFTCRAHFLPFLLLFSLNWTSRIILHGLHQIR